LGAKGRVASLELPFRARLRNLTGDAGRVETFEHYQLLKDDQGNYIELGHGGMGVTYKALDTSLQCLVALKVISASLLGSTTAEERFLREARSAAQLRHRNVASVFHLGRHGEGYYYAMEFIDGETVEMVVKRDGPMECQLALEIAEQVACALVAAERRRLVHRDIKPSNLMLVREGDGDVLVKVIDFGLVKSAVPLGASISALTTGGFVGTPYFASPEQLDQQDEDGRSDIYSLGVTLWYMLTGKPTFSGSLASVITQHLDKPPPFDDLPPLPEEIVVLLRRMLEKEVERRIQSPTELRSELRRCIEIVRAWSLSNKSIKPSEVEETGQSGLGTSSVLKGRYRLIEDLNPSQPGELFHAEDTKLKQRVTLRILHGSPSALERAAHDAAQARTAEHPNLVKVLAIETEKNFGFMVLEWMEGFSLIDLMRARRELPLREVLLLLRELATAADVAAGQGIRPDLSLAGVFVQFPEGITPSSTEVLLSCPVDEWPAWRAKVHIVAGTGELDPLATVVTAQGEASSGKSVIMNRLAALAYSLLGGDPRNFIPLAKLNWETMAVLRRGLSSDHGFASAGEFFEALGRTQAIERGPGKSVTPSAGIRGISKASFAPAKRKEASPPSVAPTPHPEQKSAPQTIARGHKSRVGILVAGAILFAVAVAAGLFFSWNFFSSEPPWAPTPVGAAPAQKRAAGTAAPSLSPPQSGKSWTNSLGMSFVPVGDVHMAVFEARVRDFESFVKATDYDAEGGMSSVMKLDGFASRNLTWRSPGFPQTPDHPIVGVCWEDADQFCAWLTRKERSEGTITAFQRYRLPTDREWSEAVGIAHEEGATPEERSGRLVGLFPWGGSMPPAENSGNYAGEESRQGAPAGWSFLRGYRDAFPRTAPVEAMPANPAGVHGLSGNVWEWCADRFNQSTNWRVLRGGSWASSRPEEMLSSYRRGYDALFRMDDTGFRLVIAAEGRQR
jgi:serine/threonine protein kinase/formylglycine-generating enzyme required for sulfatase activity